MRSDQPRRARVLTLCGSLQQHSANDAVLEVARARLRHRGDVVDDYRTLGDLPGFDADVVDAPGRVVDDWRQRVAVADAVLIAAPEYAGGVAGVVKNALD